MAADFECTVELPRDRSAPARARAQVKEALEGRADRRRVGELAVIVSELVTNALEHGEGAIRMRLRVDGGKATGEVIDDGGGFEHQVRDVGVDELRGRGLMLVDALSTRWGLHEGTTHVWFEMDLGARDDDGSGPALGAAERPDELPPA